MLQGHVPGMEGSMMPAGSKGEQQGVILEDEPSMDMPFLDAKSMTPAEEFAFMLQERLDKVEEQLEARYKKLLAGMMMTIQDSKFICADVFSFLLGAQSCQRSWSCCIPNAIKSIPRNSDGEAIVTPRAHELFQVLTAKDAEAGIVRVPLWELKSENHVPFNYGFNLGSVLYAMTLDELETYWAWRVAATCWVLGDGN